MAVILLLAVHTAHAQNTAATRERSPFALRLVGPLTLVPNEFSPLELEVENVSDRPVTFVRPLDGSVVQARYPHISVTILDSEGRPVPEKLGIMCGVLNPLRTEDIQTFAPGEKRRYGVSWPTLQTPGKYTVSLTYNLAAPDLQSWMGSMKAEEAPTELSASLKEVPRSIIESNPLQVQVRDFDARTVAEAIAIHFSNEDSAFVGYEDPAFVGRDLERGLWEVSDIRHVRGYFSCLVKFAPGYTLPPLPVLSTPEFQFAEGRYLFQPEHHWRSNPHRVAVAERNIVASRFKVHPPGPAPRQARHDFFEQKDILALGFPLRSPEEMRERAIAEQHPLYRAYRERLGEPYYPDYLWVKGVLADFRPPVPNEGYMSPAVGFHLGFEGDAIKLITVEGELRYLLLVESPLSAPLLSGGASGAQRQRCASGTSSRRSPGGRPDDPMAKGVERGTRCVFQCFGK
jgi:hypothetical protein